MTSKESILRDLFRGNISPIDMKFDAQSEYNIELEKHNIMIEELTKTLSEEEVNSMEELLEHEIVLQSFSDCENFIMGFKMGVKFMMAIL